MSDNCIQLLNFVKVFFVILSDAKDLFVQKILRRLRMTMIIQNGIGWPVKIAENDIL